MITAAIWCIALALPIKDGDRDCAAINRILYVAAAILLTIALNR